ncbi:MAG TPA: GNAT family N-acetyltransferase [Candidatus Dormibacteraeota bacterium]
MAKASVPARKDGSAAKARARPNSSSEFTIRAATHDDLRAIVGIYNWAVNQTFATIDSEPLDTEEAAEWWEAHGKRSKLLVATDETGVVGWARLFPWNQRGFDIVEDLVYVDPVHQGRGIGRSLLTELITEARGLGYRTIVATIATDNRPGLALHTRHGFETVGTIRDAAHKFDRWMDITLVQRSLEGGEG